MKGGSEHKQDTSNLETGDIEVNSEYMDEKEEDVEEEEEEISDSSESDESGGQPSWWRKLPEERKETLLWLHEQADKEK